MDSGTAAREPADGFQKRTLSIRSFLASSWWFATNLPRLARATLTSRIDDQFREKILLAVTAANDCRYCARFHTATASLVGVDDETIDRILATDIETAVSDAERPALLFALHYADTDGTPSPELVTALEAAYEPKTAADIVALTRAMHLANLLGNTVDATAYHTERRIDGALTDARQRCPISETGLLEPSVSVAGDGDS